MTGVTCLALSHHFTLYITPVSNACHSSQNERLQTPFFYDLLDIRATEAAH